MISENQKNANMQSVSRHNSGIWESSQETETRKRISVDTVETCAVYTQYHY